MFTYFWTIILKNCLRKQLFTDFWTIILRTCLRRQLFTDFWTIILRNCLRKQSFKDFYVQNFNCIQRWENSTHSNRAKCNVTAPAITNAMSQPHLPPVAAVPDGAQLVDDESGKFWECGAAGIVGILYWTVPLGIERNEWLCYMEQLNFFFFFFFFFFFEEAKIIN